MSSSASEGRGVRGGWFRREMRAMIQRLIRSKSYVDDINRTKDEGRGKPNVGNGRASVISRAHRSKSSDVLGQHVRLWSFNISAVPHDSHAPRTPYLGLWPTRG